MSMQQKHSWRRRQTMPWRPLLLAVAELSFLAGCSTLTSMKLSHATPDELQHVSNADLCIASFSRHATRAMDLEIERRKYDCTFYDTRHAEAADRANRSARILGAAQIFQGMAAQPRPAPIPDLFPKRIHCTKFGDGVQCTQY